MNTVRSRCLLGLTVVALSGWPGAAFAAESEALGLARKLNQAFIEVADTVSPSVVVVSVAHKADYSDAEMEANPLWEWLPPELRRQMEERFRQRRTPRSRAPIFDGQGSGIVIREDGYILTNGHVIEGADKIKVRFRDGTEHPAEVRGVDPQSDVAVIRIDAKGLPAARFADSDKVRVGEFAIAIGAPFELDYSVTFGHVSAKGRSAIIPDAPTLDQDFIQTDANINPGNSGGPLVNIDGEVIGINTLIRGLRTGIGFAIPSNLVLEVARPLIEEGRFTRAWLGIEIRALRDDVDVQDMVSGVKEGVVVRGIVQDGPAAKSDLRLGDVITTVDGQPVATAQQLRSQVRTRKIGSKVVLDVVRGGKELKVSVSPEPWPEDLAITARRGAPPTAPQATDLGMTVKPLTRELAKEMRLEFSEGVVVTAVDPDSVAAAKGVEPGDIITQVNRSETTTIRQFREAVEGADLAKGVVVNLVRGGVSRFVVLKEASE